MAETRKRILAHAIVLLDQAGWHGAKALKVPSNISLLLLPPRAPELNGQENVLQFMRTFLRNHAPDIAAMDLFVVPTIGFALLYALVIIRLLRRDLLWINATTLPAAVWTTP